MLDFFRRGKMRIPARHRSAAYMNLAFGVTPTVTASTFGSVPAPLVNLVDEDEDSHLTNVGIASANLAAKKGIKIDLGKIYEVYEINVKNSVGKGFLAASGSTGQIRIITSVDDSTYTDRSDHQAPGTVYEDADVDYRGDGIPVRYVMLEFDTDATHTITADISEIQVWGC